jgi:hypothetical protein
MKKNLFLKLPLWLLTDLWIYFGQKVEPNSGKKAHRSFISFNEKRL